VPSWQIQIPLKTRPTQKLALSLGKIILTGLLVLSFSLYFLYPQIFYCELIGLSGFKSGNGKIYFSPDIKTKEYAGLKRLVSRAESRIDSFYTGRNSSPKVIICRTPQQYRRYCSSTEGAGCSIGTPWGSTYVILNAQGMNTDVIAHEMSHIELLKRLGWWKTAREVPQWFNEGLALMLDRRFIVETDPVQRYRAYRAEWRYYTRNGRNRLSLKEISTISEFFKGDQRHVMTAYMTSGMEVSRWLIKDEKGALARLIKQMNEGRTFAEAYGAHQFKDSKKISE
jgi:hypothetical protein